MTAGKLPDWAIAGTWISTVTPITASPGLWYIKYVDKHSLVLDCYIDSIGTITVDKPIHCNWFKEEVIAANLCGAIKILKSKEEHPYFINKQFNKDLEGILT